MTIYKTYLLNLWLILNFGLLMVMWSVALLPIGGCYGSQQIGKTVCDFVVEQLKDLNYTILDVEFSY